MYKFKDFSNFFLLLGILVLGISCSEQSPKPADDFPKDIVGGGTGSYYSADNIWILGRQQDKDGSEIAGYHFIINIEKSICIHECLNIILSRTFNKINT